MRSDLHIHPSFLSSPWIDPRSGLTDAEVRKVALLLMRYSFMGFFRVLKALRTNQDVAMPRRAGSAVKKKFCQCHR